MYPVLHSLFFNFLEEIEILVWLYYFFHLYSRYEPTAPMYPVHVLHSLFFNFLEEIEILVPGLVVLLFALVLKV